VNKSSNTSNIHSNQNNTSPRFINLQHVALQSLDLHLACRCRFPEFDILKVSQLRPRVMIEN
jgi:hypothetical protein